MAAFLMWALAAASAVYWWLAVAGVSETPITAAMVAEPIPALSAADLAKALGPATAARPEAQASTLQSTGPDPGANLRLLGVVASRKSSGVALISIDGQVARPYRVGSRIDDRYRLTKVGQRSATLSPEQSPGAAITLELPSSAMLGAAAQLPPGIAAPRGSRFDEASAVPATEPPVTRP